MQFNSFIFLAFFPAVLLLVALTPPRRRRFIFLPASLFFYGWWDWRFLALICFTITLDWGCAMMMDRQGTRRRFWLLASVATDLTVLGFFKYFDFFVDNAMVLISTLGLEPHRPTLSVLLPIGISFFTFQSMAYTIDVYRGRVKPIDSWLTYAAYVSFFPQLVAGPIERAQTLMPQLLQPAAITVERVRSGLVLILFGLMRKVVIADTAAPIVDSIFAAPGTRSTLDLAVGAFLFALQIYGDFAGYSDMARGLARMMGVDLVQNFRRPYFSTSVTEFWRRWHISLSFWLRDYLYIPLGGNRCGQLRNYGNLLATMLLGGLWHGAAWTFVIWGAIHGIALAVEKFVRIRAGTAEKQQTVTGRIMGWAITMLIVGFAWIFFRAQGLDQAIAFYEGLFSLRPGVDFLAGLVAVLCLAGVLVIDLSQRLDADEIVVRSWVWPVRGVVYALMILLTITFSSADVPFIYFQF